MLTKKISEIAQQDPEFALSMFIIDMQCNLMWLKDILDIDSQLITDENKVQIIREKIEWFLEKDVNPLYEHLTSTKVEAQN